MPQHLQAITAGVDPAGIYRQAGEIFDVQGAQDLSAWTVVVPGGDPDDPTDPGTPSTGIPAVDSNGA